MASLTSQLIVTLLDRISAPARGVAKAVEGMRQRVDANNARMDAMRGRMVEAAAVAYGLARAVSAPVKAAIEFESAMADLAKVTDFSDRGLSDYGKALRRLASSEIPMAVNELVALSSEAAAAGVAQEDLLRFTEMTARAAVAWGVSGAQAGEDLAKLQTALGLTIEQTGRYADAINFLSDRTASTAPDLVDFSRRVAAQGEFFGFAKEETLAFGSAMISAGAESEVAATSFRNMGKALTRGASATKAQRGAYKKLGLDAVKIAKAMQKNAVGTTMKVIERLGRLPEHMRAAVMSDLFGDEARALAPLLGNVEQLRTTLGYVGDETAYAGSVAAEFAKRAQTTEYAVQRFKNQLYDLGLTVGSILLPALNRIMDVVGPLVTRLAELAEAYPDVTRAIIFATTALVGLRLAGLAAQFAFGWMRGAYLSAALAGLTSMAAAAGRTGAAFKAMRTAVTGGRARTLAVEAAANARALAEQTSAAYRSSLGMQALARQGAVAGVSLKAANAAVAAAGKEASAAQLALAAANTQLKATGPAARLAAVGLGVARGAATALKLALIGTGIGAVLVGIAAAGTWIYNNWSGIKEMFAGIAEGLRSAFPGAGAVVDAVTTSIGWLFDGIVKLTGPVDATGEAWRALGIKIGTAIGEIVQYIAALPGKIAAMAGEMAAAGTELAASMIEGVKAKIGELVEWFKTLPRRILEAIGRIDLSGLIKWPSMPSWPWGGGKSPPAPANPPSSPASTPSSVPAGLPAVDGARAAGGTIFRGRTYLTSEEGPELITAGTDGYVHTADETREILAGRGDFDHGTAESYDLDRRRTGSQGGGTALAGPRQPDAARPAGPAPNLSIEIAITNHGVNDPEQLAGQLEAVLKRRLREMMGGQYADLNWGAA